jgi:hypothetical protein
MQAWIIPAVAKVEMLAYSLPQITTLSYIQTNALVEAKHPVDIDGSPFEA